MGLRPFGDVVISRHRQEARLGHCGSEEACLAFDVSSQGHSYRRQERRAGLKLPRNASFLLLAALLGLFLFAASAPSPLYAVYQAKLGFSSTTLTAIYAVYALGALVALLTTGRLSDHLGRRRVVVLALVIQIAGLVAFIAAQGVGMLYLGRILQGVGTGIATGALSAWLLDLQPPDNSRLGSLVGGIAPVAGLAAGALGSGLLVEYGPEPLRLVFWLLTLVFMLALAAMPITPDLVERNPGWLRSMRPQISVPAGARSLFAALVPSLIAIWALGGLYLSLGPSVAISLLKTNSRIAGGLVIAGLMGAAAVASALVRAAEPRVILIRGSLVLIAGVGITLIAVAMGSITGLYAGSVIAGLGFGPAFSGIFRSLAPLAPPEKRGALLASIYVVLYPSFSVPAIIAGIAVTQFDLRTTTYVFGLIVMALAAVTTVVVYRRPGPDLPQ
jgi:MFS family permease